MAADESELTSSERGGDALRLPTRPKLQSKATTAVSLTDVHTATPGGGTPRTPASRSRAASIARSVSKFGPGSLRVSPGGEPDDGASTRSIRSFAGSAALDVDSLIGDLKSLQRGDTHTKDTSLNRSELAFFTDIEDQDIWLRNVLDREFEELEPFESDGSNEESLMSRWTQKLKHYIILSSAGKPIYSRHGDEQLISNSIGVVQTVISIIESGDDTLKSFTAGETQFVVLSKDHLYLLAVSRIQESEAELRSQLEALYMQILSALTLPHMERMFHNRPSTDLRRPLEGTEKLLSALADGFTRGSPSTLLSALECLRLRKSHREAIDRSMVKCKSTNLLYGLIVAGGRLVSVIRPKKHSLHPGDLHLVFNMLFKTDGLRASEGENWIPICLPGFNNTGYLYMYVSLLEQEDKSNLSGSANQNENVAPEKSTKAEDVVIVLISTSKESFFELREMRNNLYDQLKVNGSLENILRAVKAGRPSCTDIIPGTVLRHFLYKSRANVQFVMPSPQPHFASTFNWRRLVSIYSTLHAAVHAKSSNLKVYHKTTASYVSLAWISPLFEIYCIASPTTGRTALAQAANKLEQWARREEERLFILGGAVF